MSVLKKIKRQIGIPEEKHNNSALDNTENPEVMKNSLLVIASEVYRIQKIFVPVLSKLGPEDQIKYTGQLSWFLKKVGKSLAEAGFKTVSLEGMDYDPGMAVTPLNLDEFDTEDTLIIEQMMEPIVMFGDSICKTGTVLLGRKNQ